MTEEKEEKRINPYTLQEELPTRLFSNKFMLIGLVTILFSGGVLYFTGQLAPNNEADYLEKVRSEKEDSLRKLKMKPNLE